MNLYKTLGMVALCAVICFHSSGCDSSSGPLVLISVGFEQGHENWKVEGKKWGGSTPELRQGEGNPGNSLFAISGLDGGSMYWIASQDFLTEFSREVPKYLGKDGLDLTYELKQTPLDELSHDEDVVISDGSQTIAYYLGQRPNTSWSQFNIPLEPSGWYYLNKNGNRTDKQPTMADFEDIIRDVKSLKIRAEYQDGRDSNWLDNIRVVVD
ncbi:MAG: hypothetical protein ACI8UO_001674 [Verrucomicrobiales bacterium]|jgi:hypothetical protein